MSKFAKVHLKTVSAKEKVYTFAELHEHIDFTPKRLYIIANEGSTTPTGQHCHHEEKEFFIMTQGECTAIIDSGNGREDVHLEHGDAIYVPNYVWHGFKDLSADAIITALSSTNYRQDRSDYIEDYDEYLKIRDEKLKKA